MTVGDLANAVPVGSVADEIGSEDRPGAGADHLLDGVDIDLEGVGRDVDEDRDELGPQHGGEIGGERDGRRDDLVARLEIKYLNGEVER